MRAFFALMLSLVLAFASVSMAVARGQEPMGDAIALCLDGTAVTVTLDADGNPISALTHLCPDCLSAATTFDLPQPVGLSAPVWRETQTDAVPAAARSYIHTAITPAARGPPVLSV